MTWSEKGYQWIIFNIIRKLYKVQKCHTIHSHDNIVFKTAKNGRFAQFFLDKFELPVIQDLYSKNDNKVIEIV